MATVMDSGGLDPLWELVMAAAKESWFPELLVEFSAKLEKPLYWSEAQGLWVAIRVGRDEPESVPDD